MAENTEEVLDRRTIDISPAPAKVMVKTIEVEPGSWEEHVGAVGECDEVYRMYGDRVSPKRLGIVFEHGGNWAIAADGHEMYEFPGGSSQLSCDDVTWTLDKLNQLVRDDSPKTTWRPA